MSEQKRLNRVVTSAPINRTAARVTERDGEHFDASAGLKDFERMSCREMPFPVRKPNSSELGQQEFVDLKAVRVGRLTVIGQYDYEADGDHGDVLASSASSKNNGGQRWVCRCSCGWYQLQRGPFIRKFIRGAAKKADEEPMCARCNYLAHVKNRYERLPPRKFHEGGDL